IHTTERLFGKRPYDEYIAADVALRQIGTNSVPYLLRLIRERDSVIKTKFIELVQKQHVVRFNPTTAWELNQRAVSGFHILGTAASNAVPALVEALQARVSPDSESACARALAEIGPGAINAIPALTNAYPTAPT